MGGGSGLPSSSLLLSAARGHLASSLVSGCGRNPADFVPHMQLAWELEEMLNNNNASGVSTTAEAEGLEAERSKGRSRQMLAAVHEMWLSWHVAVWDNPVGRSRGGSGASHEVLQSAPARLYMVSPSLERCLQSRTNI